MEYNNHVALGLNDRSYLSVVRKEIKKIAESVGFKETALGKIDIIAAELTSNLVKHVRGGGEILVRVINDIVQGIEIIAVDNGPGMKNVALMLEDGVSSTHTLGQGLGAIKRLSHKFDIYSQPGWGTVVLSRYFISEKTAPVRPKADWGVVSIPKSGEQLCGDGWAIKIEPDIISFLAVDGLGHGPEAYVAAQAAVSSFATAAKGTLPADVLIEMHTAIRRTRGVVGAMVQFIPKTKELKYCGIGNTSTRIYGSALNKSFISYNGIIGMNRPGVLHNQLFSAEGNSLMIMTSDGIKTKYDLNKLPDIQNHDCGIIAAAVYKEFSRKTDDTLVFVARL